MNNRWVGPLLIVFAFIVWRSRQSDDGKNPPAPVPGPDPQVVTGLLPDLKITANPEQLAMVVDFLSDGRLELENGVTVDASGVQSVTIANGVARFSPPVTARWDGPGPLRAGTTITEARVTGVSGSILIDLDRSPVDIEVRPEGQAHGRSE